MMTVVVMFGAITYFLLYKYKFSNNATLKIPSLVVCCYLILQYNTTDLGMCCLKKNYVRCTMPISYKM